MNQQRSRRFRSAQEAKEKEEQRKEAIAMFEGRCARRTFGASLLTSGDSTRKAGQRGDQEQKVLGLQCHYPRFVTLMNVTMTDCFVLGTPFMDFLAESLRYWVVTKMNSDPGWKNVKKIACFRRYND
jgi:5'-3' exoribonuclease 2